METPGCRFRESNGSDCSGGIGGGLASPSGFSLLAGFQPRALQATTRVGPAAAPEGYCFVISGHAHRRTRAHAGAAYRRWQSQVNPAQGGYARAPRGLRGRCTRALSCAERARSELRTRSFLALALPPPCATTAIGRRPAPSPMGIFELTIYTTTPSNTQNGPKPWARTRRTALAVRHTPPAHPHAASPETAARPPRQHRVVTPSTLVLLLVCPCPSNGRRGRRNAPPSHSRLRGSASAEALRGTKSRREAREREREREVCRR